MFKKVLGIVSLVGVVAVGSGVGCTVKAVDPSDGGTAADTGPVPSTSSTIDASKPKTDGAALTCYDERGAIAEEGTAPVRSAGKCTDVQITELDKQCFGSSSTGCDAFITANKDCARCILGALQGDNAATTPIGALLTVSDDGTVVPNTASCAALFIGKPECAAKLAKQEVCLASACSVCKDDPTDAACRKEAAAGICKTVIDATCTQAVESRAAEWQAACSGADFDTTYPKVAKFLCGGSTDGGTGSTDAGGGG